MNTQDENALTEAWHSDTNWLNEKVDELFKSAQDNAYALGLSRGMKDAEEKAATQHALIVQMAEALASLYSVAPSKAPGAGLIVGAEAKHSAALDSSRAAIAAATQYLKGPKT